MPEESRVFLKKRDLQILETTYFHFHLVITSRRKGVQLPKMPHIPPAWLNCRIATDNRH